jgi:hypothetical protein
VLQLLVETMNLKENEDFLYDQVKGNFYLMMNPNERMYRKIIPTRSNKYRGFDFMGNKE